MRTICFFMVMLHVFAMAFGMEMLKDIDKDKGEDKESAYFDEILDEYNRLEVLKTAFNRQNASLTKDSTNELFDIQKKLATWTRRDLQAFVDLAIYSSDMEAICQCSHWRDLPEKIIYPKLISELEKDKTKKRTVITMVGLQDAFTIIICKMSGIFPKIKCFQLLPTNLQAYIFSKRSSKLID